MDDKTFRDPESMHKRLRADESKDEESTIDPKKRKMDEVGDDLQERDSASARYFVMPGFPPLMHPMTKYNAILERSAYATIFDELMVKVKLCFDCNRDANMVLAGNPGIGKSRFYLYCMFRLTHDDGVDAKKLDPFELVLNCGDDFQKYLPESKEFVELDDEDVDSFMSKKRVLRLVEGDSSKLNGWTGVSILFASPNVKGMNNYAKVNSYTYVMPAWTLDELQDYNSILSDDLKLSDARLISRFNKFGGVPRRIFTTTEIEAEQKLAMAIESFTAEDVVSYARGNHSPIDRMHDHSSILKMMPAAKDFRAISCTDFQSDYIAEKVINKMDEKILRKLSKIVIGQEESGALEETFAYRGTVYRMLCHRRLNEQQKLQFRSLGTEAPLDLILGNMKDIRVPTSSGGVVMSRGMEIRRFSNLGEIHAAQIGRTYFRPASAAFKPLDAFILDTNKSECYGLVMTLHSDHGIEAEPLNQFLKWLKRVGVPVERFSLCFITPSDLEKQFKMQTVRTDTDQVLQSPEPSVSVKQFVAALDAFIAPTHSS